MKEKIKESHLRWHEGPKQPMLDVLKGYKFIKIGKERNP